MTDYAEHLITARKALNGFETEARKLASGCGGHIGDAAYYADLASSHCIWLGFWCNDRRKETATEMRAADPPK